MPIETCVLVNKNRTLRVLNLPAHLVPELSTRMVIGTQAHDPKTGERQLQAKRANVSGSLTFMPAGMEGSKLEVSRAVLRAPEVQAAIRRKEIGLEEPKPAAPAEEKKDEPPPTGSQQNTPPLLTEGGQPAPQQDPPAAETASTDTSDKATPARNARNPKQER
jgi:hypothetical protein